jgi:predicted DNA-binding transcriptional regulator YafY
MGTEEIADGLGVSVRTVRRYARYLEDHGAPIEADHTEGGYRYTHTRFELHGQWLSEDELIGLVLARRLASAIPDRSQKDEIHRLFSRIYQRSPALAQLDRRISLKNICYYRVEPAIFNSVLHSLYQDCKLQVTYRSVFSPKETERTICPLHLVLYRGNWHLIAWCELRSAVRFFTLSRIRKITVLRDQACPSHRLDHDFHDRLETVHGIFLSKEPIQVTLRFTASLADFVREQVWFPGQTIDSEPDGQIRVTFPVGDYPEIIQEILGYGPEVEVIEPQDLRTIIRERIEAMSARYRPE